MPEMNGCELAELIQPIRPEMRVVFMTGYTEDEVRKHGFSTRELDVIGKPFSPASLTAKINEVINESMGLEVTGGTGTPPVFSV